MSKSRNAICQMIDFARRSPLVHQHNQGQLFCSDVDPWRNGQENGYFDAAPSMAQGSEFYDPNVGPSQAQLDLNAADPSAQALLRFLMQSDYEFSMR